MDANSTSSMIQIGAFVSQGMLERGENTRFDGSYTHQRKELFRRAERTS